MTGIFSDFAKRYHLQNKTFTTAKEFTSAVIGKSPQNKQLSDLDTNILTNIVQNFENLSQLDTREGLSLKDFRKMDILNGSYERFGKRLFEKMEKNFKKETIENKNGYEENKPLYQTINNTGISMVNDKSYYQNQIKQGNLNKRVQTQYTQKIALLNQEISALQASTEFLCNKAELAKLIDFNSTDPCMNRSFYFTFNADGDSRSLSKADFKLLDIRNYTPPKK